MVTLPLCDYTPIGIFYHGSDYKFDLFPLDGKANYLAHIAQIGNRGCLFTLDSLGSGSRWLLTF